MRTRTMLRLALLRLTGAALLLAGCDGGPPLIPPDPDAGPRDGGLRADSGPLPRVDAGTDGGPPPSALVRFVHAAPGTPTLDLRADGRTVAHDVYYRSASPYRAVGVGEVTLAAFDAADPEGAPITSIDGVFEDGVRYVAVVHDPADAPPTLWVVEEGEPTVGGLAVRVLNATHDTASLDVDLDGDERALEVDDLAAGAASDWVGVGALRPVVTAGASEPFTLTTDVQPWLRERALLVITGRPTSARPSELAGLSIVLVLEATETASPFFVLRPDPRLAILQASPRLGPSVVTVRPNSGESELVVASALAFGALVETVAPPGTSSVQFQPPDVFFGPSVQVDLLPGHRYLLVTRGDPDRWGPDRFGGELIREAQEGDRFVVVHASLDAPGPARFYSEDTAFAPIAQLDALSYAQRSAGRGVPIDPSQRLGLAREDRTAPNVWFDAPATVGTRGFLVLGGSYFAASDARDVLTAFWVWAPVGERWSLSAVPRDASSGPLPDEAPPAE